MDTNRLVDDIIVARYVKSGEMPSAKDLSEAILPHPTTAPAQRVYRLRKGAMVLTSEIIASLSNFSGLSPAYFMDTASRPSLDEELQRIIHNKKQI